MINIKKYIVSFLATIKGDRVVISKFKRMEQAIKRTGRAPKAGTKHTNDFVKALKRAAVVAPVWLLLRAVMMKVIMTIKEGAKAWVEWDKALIKSKAVIHGASTDITVAYKTLQDATEQLSLKTGVSLDKITNAFFRFGTLGIKFEDSLAGMTASMNIALAMGGDLEQVAKPLAFAYKLLGDTLDQSISPAERMEQVGSKLFAIWKINAFEINEFSASLNNFLPTANTANFTLDETVTLLTALSSSAILGARGGRLLRQSVLRLVANLGILSSELGIAVNPQLESTNDILLKVLGRIKELGETGTVQKAGKALTAIFGGARMGEAARGLISVFDLIQENINITTASGEDLTKQVETYLDRLEEVENSLGRQAEIGKNLDTQIGRMFLKGIFGGEKFADTLKEINKLKLDISVIGEEVGVGLREFFTFGSASMEKWIKQAEEFAATLVKGVTGKLPSGELETLIKDLETKGKIEVPIEFNREQLIKDLKESLDKIKAARFLEEIPVKESENEVEIVKRISFENQIKLNLLQEGLKISKLETSGLSKTQIAQKQLNAEIKERVNQYNTLIDREKLGLKILEEKQILHLLETRQYNKILDLTEENIFNEGKVLELAKKQINVEKLLAKENKAKLDLLIKYKMNLLTLNGATKSQLAEARIALEQQVNIGQDELSIYSKKLELEKEITGEKLKQNRASGETVKLAKISRKYGTPLAAKFADILRGELPFSILFGKQKRIFKKAFSGRLEEAEARKEFIDKPSVHIQERGIPDRERIIKLPNIKTSIGNLKVEVKQILSTKSGNKKLSDQIVDAFIKALKDDERIKQAIDEKIEDY